MLYGNHWATVDASEALLTLVQPPRSAVNHLYVLNRTYSRAELALCALVIDPELLI